eukprot:1006873-Prymnesium_polylepis.1
MSGWDHLEGKNKRTGDARGRKREIATSWSPRAGPRPWSRLELSAQKTDIHNVNNDRSKSTSNFFATKASSDLALGLRPSE